MAHSQTELPGWIGSAFKCGLISDIALITAPECLISDGIVQTSLTDRTVELEHLVGELE